MSPETGVTTGSGKEGGMKTPAEADPLIENRKAMASRTLPSGTKRFFIFPSKRKWNKSSLIIYSKTAEKASKNDVKN
jgi:hypothetical protein